MAGTHWIDSSNATATMVNGPIAYRTSQNASRFSRIMGSLERLDTVSSTPMLTDDTRLSDNRNCFHSYFKKLHQQFVRLRVARAPPIERPQHRRVCLQ